MKNKLIKKKNSSCLFLSLKVNIYKIIILKIAYQKKIISKE
jgi:hypothetical protein